MRSIVLLLLATLLAGCSGQEGEDPVFRVGGAFTSDRAEGDLEDLRQTAAPYSEDVVIMESFPEQFDIRGIEKDCEELRTILLGKDYIANVSECQEYLR